MSTIQKVLQSEVLINFYMIFFYITIFENIWSYFGNTSDVFNSGIIMQLCAAFGGSVAIIWWNRRIRNRVV